MQTSPDFADLTVRIAKAQNMVGALCRGDARWVMRVPPQPDADPDLVIADGLQAGMEAVAALKARMQGGNHG